MNCLCGREIPNYVFEMAISSSFEPKFSCMSCKSKLTGFALRNLQLLSSVEKFIQEKKPESHFWKFTPGSSKQKIKKHKNDIEGRGSALSEFI